MNVYECTLVIADGIAETQAVGAAIELQVERIIGTQAATSGGVSDGNKGDIAVSGSGEVWNINAGAVDSAELASNSVTSAKIASGNVSTDKLTDGAVNEVKIADGSVTVTKIGTGAVNESKLATGSVTETKLGARSVTAAKLFEVGHEKLIGRHGAGAGDAQEIGIDGGLEFQGGNIRRAALTGDVTASAGDNATTLANSGVTAATYGSASAIPVITVDAKGRITSATTATPSGSSVMKPRWTSFTTSGSTTATIPIDNTKPQNTEGYELVKLTSVTPSSSGNSIEVVFSANLALSNTSIAMVALFVGTAVDAAAFNYDSISASNGQVVTCRWIIPSWSGAKDLAVRVGSGTTLWWNRAPSADFFGGTMAVNLSAKELEV